MICDIAKEAVQEFDTSEQVASQVADPDEREPKPALKDVIADAERRHLEQLGRHQPRPVSDPVQDIGEIGDTLFGTTPAPKAVPVEPEH